jgi:hypothetical protein
MATTQSGKMGVLRDQTRIRGGLQKSRLPEGLKWRRIGHDVNELIKRYCRSRTRGRSMAATERLRYAFAQD